ncbi:hypothetical protein EXIGLDRAFT_195577 [Exidia glandulosa HHB12029]|uniref:RRM domain-containing protein n=2 Tax=Exidia glandulosa HHB12029 TaxID=1314781 RepID=A0A165EVN9_EXIGL|nr:hypothetical protein EXIGLDRAFT_195577 [Exidia glandulosa HHB12029]
MGEEQLIEVFKNVGQVVGFRLVFDRDTGKPRGYGFCEFADHETAMSAVRNLNNTLVEGRPLRIDLADSDPFLEGKTTSRGELLDDGGAGAARWRGAVDDFLASVPTGVPVPPGSTSLDVITQSLAAMRPPQAYELLAQMKAFIINSPEQAHQLLVSHPQLAYALFQALLLHQIVDPAVLQRMLGAAQAQPPPSAYGAQPQPPIPPPSVRPPMPAYMQPPMGMMPQPPPNLYAGAPQQMPAYPPPAPTPVQAAPGVPDSQKVLMQVLQLTPDQIALLPENDRKAIMDLRQKFLGGGA